MEIEAVGNNNPTQVIKKKSPSKKAAKTLTAPSKITPVPTFTLTSTDGSFDTKRIELWEPVIIGRQTSPKTAPLEANGYFDNKVLSRTHAQIYHENGKVYIKDTKSSNGTFVNGKRLSEEGLESDPVELFDGDSLEFGVDILKEDGISILYQKIGCKVNIQSGKSLASTKENTEKDIKDGAVPPPQIESNNGSAVVVPSDTILQEEFQKSVQQGQELTKIKTILVDLKDTITKPSSEGPGDQLSALQRQIQAYIEKINELEPLAAQHKSLRSERDQLEKKVEDLNNDLTKIQKRLTSEIDERKAEFQKLISSKEKDEQNLKKENNNLKDQLANLQKELEEKKSQNSRLQEKYNESNSKCEALKNTLSQLEEKYLQTETDSSSIKSKYDHLVRSSQELEQIKSLNDKESEKVKNELSDLRNSVKTKEEELYKLKEKLAQSEQEIQVVKSQLLQGGTSSKNSPNTAIIGISVLVLAVGIAGFFITKK